MKLLIRESKKDDAYDIAHVVAISWNETYKGIVPDWFLKELLLNEKENGKRLYDNYGNNHELVLIIDNEIVGFIRYGKSEDDDFDNCGEIIAFYIIKKYHGNGLGRKLFEMARNDLKKEGYNKMIIACLKGNSTNEFYKHMGGKYIKDGEFKKLNLKENIYYFDI